MISLVSAAVHLSLRAGFAPSDTVWLQAPTTQSWFQRITGVASGVMTLALLGLAIAVMPAAWNFRRTYRRAAQLLEKVQVDATPLLRHAHAIADNVDYISTAIREDVGMIHGTLTEANDRLKAALEMTERRMHDFSALMAVVQQEAEGVFVSTAATVQGFRAGASSFAGGDGPELASVESDDDGLEAVVDDEETDDGTDSSSSDDASASRAPRIIRRARARDGA